MNARELRLAVVHKVISDSNDIGKTRLQKLCYFLQEALQVPTKYTFRMHHYGPYTEALETDVAQLCITGYANMQPDLQGYGFHISSIDSPQNEWEELVRAHSKSIETAIAMFSEWTTSKLELAATIHFVNNLLPDKSPPEILCRVKALKPKFVESYISQVHDELRQYGLLK